MAKHRKAADNLRENDSYLKAILDHLDRVQTPIASHTPWLISKDIWASQWTCRFDKAHTFDVNWDINLGNCCNLKDKNLISSHLRAWICAQTHPRVTKLPDLEPRVAYNAVNEVIRLADYFLIHHDPDELIKHGLSALSEGDLTQLITALASSSRTMYSIYQWPECLKHYLEWLINDGISGVEFENFKKKYPDIMFVSTAPEDRLLPGATDEFVVEARMALLRANQYGPRASSHNPLFIPNYTEIVSIVYGKTLRGKWISVLRAPELSWGEDVQFVREMKSVFVRENGDYGRMSRKALLKYCQRVRSLSFVNDDATGKPLLSPSIASTLDIKRITSIVRMARGGRFKSVPSALVFDSIQAGITFFIEHADHLMESYIALASAIKSSGLKPSIFLRNRNINDFISGGSVRAGIQTFAISRHYKSHEIKNEYRAYLKARAYFADLRANRGLVDSMRVLYGAVLVTLAALSARRRSEYVRLHASRYLDAGETCVRFQAAKTGFSGHRQEILVPVPDIVVEMLKKLEWFQRELIKQGVIDRLTNLFSYPLLKGGGLGQSDGIEAAIDTFLDYIEMPCDERGRRYYLRCHQLRRFFPQTFMESGLPNGREVLSEFLGHTNAEEIWTYILEVCPGDAIEQSAAQTATKQLREDNTAFEDLADLVRKTFGVYDFWAVSEEELNGYILQLQEAGDVKVAFEYFETSDGSAHRMLMKVKEPEYA